jgi:hypothetical protein
VDNVGVYTNASNPTNSGYGAWTNNYIFADWYAGNTITFGGDVFFPYVLQSTNYCWITNVVLNAKETRAWDCFAALHERYLAAGGNTTNFWEVALPYTLAEGSFTYYQLWRDERIALRAIKDALRTTEIDGYMGHGLLANFYYPTPTNGTPTNWTAYTEATLAAAAGVPTNFFDYTPHRAADGSWTHYLRVMTNTFVLCQGTNATHIATNSLVDSAGIEFMAVGTNGLVITRVATNINQQAGVSLGAYGWDGLRRVFGKLTTTVKNPSWGLGQVTNWTSRTSNSYSYASLNAFSAGTLGAPPVEADIAAGAEAANSNLPYWTGGTIAPDDWDWTLASALTNPVVVSTTNCAPTGSIFAAFAKNQDLEANFLGDRDAFGNLASTNWTVVTDDRVHVRYATNNVKSSWASIVAASATGIADRVLIVYAKTNGTPYAVYSNTMAIADGSVTATVYNVAASIDFGFTYEGADSHPTDGWELTGGGSQFSIVSYLHAFHDYVWGDPSQFQYGVSATTNRADIVYTLGQAVEVWDFDYD